MRSSVRIASLASAVLLWATQQAHGLLSYENDTYIEKFYSYTEFQEKVKKSDAIWAVTFYIKEGCTSCEELADTWRNLATVTRGLFKVGVVDTETPHGNRIGFEYNLETIPSYVILADNKDKPYAKDPKMILEEMLMAASKAIESRAQETLGTTNERDIHNQFSRGGGKKVFKGKHTPQKFSSTNVEADSSNFEQLVMECDDVVVVAFTKPECKFSRKLKRQMEEAGSRLVGEAAKSVWVNLELAPELAPRFNIRNTPTIMIFPGGAKSVKKAYAYKGDRVGTDIASAVLKEVDKTGKKKQVAQLLGRDTLEKFCRGYQHVCVIGVMPHISETGADTRFKYIQLLQRMQRIFRGSTYSFLWSEAGAQPEMEDALGLTFGFPTLVTFTLDRTAYSVFKGSFSDKGISTYLHSVANGASAVQMLPFMFPVENVEPWDGLDAPGDSFEEIPLTDIMDDWEYDADGEPLELDDEEEEEEEEVAADSKEDYYFQDEL